MKITMAHGSGGKDSALLMGNIFGKYFSNPVLNQLDDAAVLDMSDIPTGSKLACSTDTFVVTPVVFSGGNIGKLAICGTVNDLLMMGAQPKYLTCGFVLQEGLEISLLEEIVKSMANEAKKAGVIIVAGDTKVVEGKGELFINTAGIGVIPPGREIHAPAIADGDVILLSGTLGDHHACILGARMGIENPIKSDCACLGDITGALLEHGIRVKAMRDVTRGGLATILNEFSQAAGLSAEIDEEIVPVSTAVRGFCDLLGLEPFYMANEGKLIAVVAAEDANRALELMRQTENGKNAAIIGKFYPGEGVSVRTSLGSTRVLDVLYGEGLPRIC
jgi:hydrogenase expression/formation protein HypE